MSEPSLKEKLINKIKETDDPSSMRKAVPIIIRIRVRIITV